MPLDYGTTPGGTIFGTTPGGTKIGYERAFLMQMRHSPLAKSPPANLPNIPGVTSPTSGEKGDHIENGNRIDPAAKLSTVKECNKEDEDQFDTKTKVLALSLSIVSCFLRLCCLHPIIKMV